MNKDQIFAEAVNKCKGKIDRNFISQIVLEDKTNTIRKYLNSFGMTQLALFLQDLARNIAIPKILSVAIDSDYDVNQKKAQQQEKFATGLKRTKVTYNPFETATRVVKTKVKKTQYPNYHVGYNPPGFPEVIFSEGPLSFSDQYTATPEVLDEA